MNRRVGACAVLCLLLSFRPSMSTTDKPLAVPGLADRGAGRLALELDSSVWQELFRAGSARVNRFPLPNGQTVDLELASFDLVRPETRFFLGQADDVKEISGPSMRFFRGSVAGEPDSLVSLNLFGGRIAGFIRTGRTEYSFGPRSYALDSEGAMDIEVRDDSMETTPDPRCDGDDQPLKDFEPSADSPGAEAIDSTTLLLGRIAVEGTVEWVAKHGGVTAAQTYTLNLMSQVSAVYESEVRVQLQIPYVLMNAAEPDGYSGTSNSTSTMLGEMRTKWNGSASLRSIFRSAVHLFGTYPSGGAGRAYVNVLCSNVPVSTSASDYGVSLMEGNGGSWERRMVAHEIGHNFSSPHSHCFAPELDQCNNTETGCYAGTVVQTTGTIMSYCSTRLSTFHPRERDERIRPAAERAYPECVEVAGMPGTAGDLTVSVAPSCSPADLVSDDGIANGIYSYSGAYRAAWVKRMTPGCYPFKLSDIDVRISHSSVAVGRPLRVIIYTDPTGSGSIANASLVHTQDVAVQVVSSSQWNHFTLATPVLLGSGDYYLGFFDLVADDTTNYIMNFDAQTVSDSWYQADSIDPSTFGPFPNGTGSWMIRGHGGGLSPGSVLLSWGASCNDATVPGQDFAIYQGTAGNWSSYTSLTCTTAHERSWLVDDPPSGAFWLVVPQNSANEGSYGWSTMGERPPSTGACRPQATGSCP